MNKVLNLNLGIAMAAKGYCVLVVEHNKFPSIC